jgi:hypothetical protein
MLIGMGSRRRSASQAIDLPSDGGVNFERLFTVRSQAARLAAATPSVAHSTTIPKSFISECFPQPVSSEIISTCGGRQGVQKKGRF